MFRTFLKNLSHVFKNGRRVFVMNALKTLFLMQGLKNLQSKCKIYFKQPITIEYLLFPLFSEPIKEHVSTPPTTTIRHEFTHKSTSEIDEFDSTLNALNSVIDNASHFEELQRAREASENNKQSAITTKRLPNNCRLSDRKGQRLCCSAESSPILSRSMIASLSSRQQSGSPHRELRTNSITPRLVLQNIDKVLEYENFLFCDHLLLSFLFFCFWRVQIYLILPHTWISK